MYKIVQIYKIVQLYNLYNLYNFATSPKETMEAMTTLEQVDALCAEIRKEAGKAKDYSVEMSGKELSKDLVDQMAKHSKFMYAVARKLQEMVSNNTQDLDAYTPYLNRVDAAMQWFSRRKIAAEGLLRPFRVQKKKPAAKAAAC